MMYGANYRNMYRMLVEESGLIIKEELGGIGKICEWQCKLRNMLLKGRL